MSAERTVTIGTAEFSAVCPVPRTGIGFWEGFALTARGWLDARRNRAVPDIHHTHSLHRLLARHRQRETLAGLRVDAALSSVARELAPLEVVLAASGPQTLEVPTSADLASLPEDGRAGWAQQVRDARSSHAQRAAFEARQQNAQGRVAELRSIRAALVDEGEDVRRLWREAYMMRAARYTRARFGRRGAPVLENPSVAAYLPSEGPTPERT